MHALCENSILYMLQSSWQYGVGGAAIYIRSHAHHAMSTNADVSRVKFIAICTIAEAADDA